jgi:PPM family protein phosphatase
VTGIESPTCPRCLEPVRPSERFCESCGTDLRLLRGATVTAPPVGPCPGCGEPASVELEGPAGSEYCPGCGLRRRDGTDHVEIDLGALAGVSDRGKVHARNEDAMALARFESPSGIVLAAVVCDGVSSAPRAEQASRAAADAALSVLVEPGPAQPSPAGAGGTGPDPAGARLLASVGAAADAVASLAGPQDREAPACTLVAALVERIDRDRPPHITVGWVGDSRAYWLAATGAAEPARQLSTDHSWMAELVATGVPADAAALSGPGAHAITRWLGADTTAAPEVVTLSPAGPGVLLLCSDGLWNYLPAPDRLAAVAQPLLDAGAGPLAVAAELTALANQAGGRDNITVVVLPVDPAPDRHRTTPRTSP